LPSKGLSSCLPDGSSTAKTPPNSLLYAPLLTGSKELVAWWTTLTANREEIAGRPVVVDFSPDKGLIRSVNTSVPDFGERHAALGFDVTKVFFFAPDVGTP
jgi:hypothetical protein